MRPYVGAGWYIHHLTDRVVSLRKDSQIYRDLTGADGYVTTAVQPELTRDECLQQAIKKALAMDEELSFRVAKQLIPKASALQTYHMKANRLNKAFKTPEHQSVIGRKAV
jgi:hypothetical protein